MKVLFDVGHPAHVHFFKHTIWNLQKDGHKVKITVREREITTYLLEVYGFEYEKIGKNVPKLRNKAYKMIANDYKLLEIAKRFKPDILVSCSSPYAAHVSKLVRKPHIAFENTE
ncbi:MAG: DUF354 domain-containing protein, partial [Methanosarcinales archaeon]